MFDERKTPKSLRLTQKLEDHLFEIKSKLEQIQFELEKQ